VQPFLIIEGERGKEKGERRKEKKKGKKERL